MGLDVMILVFFLIFRFHLAFSLSSLTFIKRSFSFHFHFLLFRVVSSTCLKLLLFLLPILILACNSSSPAFLMMCSAHKLNEQGDDKQPCLLSFQTTRHLLSSPMLVRLLSKSCLLGFSIMWTKKFQMSKLGLEKAEEPEIKNKKATRRLVQCTVKITNENLLYSRGNSSHCSVVT